MQCAFISALRRGVLFVPGILYRCEPKRCIRVCVCVCVCVLVLALKWRCAVCNGVTLVRRSREQIQRWKLQLQRQRRRAFADISTEEEKARTA